MEVKMTQNDAYKILFSYLILGLEAANPLKQVILVPLKTSVTREESVIPNLLASGYLLLLVEIVPKTRAVTEKLLADCRSCP